MHISILLMEQIIELFIMIFMGFIIVKTGIVKDEDSKVLSKIVLYLIIPCVIINAFQVDYTSKTVRGLLIAFAASVILQLVLLFIISAMGRLFHMNEVEVASVYYSNSGNLIVPIVTFISYRNGNENSGILLTNRDFHLQTGNLGYKTGLSFTKRESCVTNGILSLLYTQT